MSKSVWAYIRVSGDEQADRGLPVAGQRRAIEEYASERNLHLARVFVDEARSGGTDQREQFQLMMHLAHQNPPPCSTILVWSWSRFARDQDDAHYWKASLRRHGVNIHDVSGETPDVQGGFEYVFESLIHWKDEQKRKEIARNARRGQQTLAKMGYVPSGSRPPRGYRVAFEEREIEGRKRRLRRWVPDPDAWPVVERAWRLRLQGRSYKHIWRETGLYKTPYCFNTFFSNRIYKGELWFGGTLIRVDPVVTAEEWARVNRNRSKRASGSYARRKGSRYLLSGLLTCARCGSSLVGFRHSGGMRGDGYVRKHWDSYVCVRRRQGTCDLPRVSAKTLEQAVLDCLFADVLTEEQLKRQREEIAKHLDADRPALEARLGALRRELDISDQAIERLLNAIERAPDSGSLPERLMDREAERERLSAGILYVQHQLRKPMDDLPDAAEMRQVLRVAIEEGNKIEAREELLRKIIAEIVVDATSANLRYRVPF